MVAVCIQYTINTLAVSNSLQVNDINIHFSVTEGGLRGRYGSQ